MRFLLPAAALLLGFASARVDPDPEVNMTTVFIPPFSI